MIHTRVVRLGLELVNLVSSFGLTQLINEPTRYESLLDLVITNCPNYIQSYGVGDQINELDHCPIFGTMKFIFKKELCYQRNVFVYNETNMNTLNENLSQVPWNALLSNTDDIDELAETFTTVLKEEINVCIPNKTVLIRPQDKPGMTGRVRSLFRKCHRLHKIASKSNSIVDIENHKIARREAKAEWRSAQKSFYEHMYNKIEKAESKSKAYWKMTKSLFGHKKMQSIPSLSRNGVIYTDDINKATILNEYFVSQTMPNNSDLSVLNDYDTLTDPSIPIIDQITVSKEKILGTLKSLKIDKSCGPDGIGNRVLKACADSLAEPLMTISQHSLNTGKFPSCWKKANIVPIFKKNDRSIVSNYRPVSLLSCVSKIVERQVFNELYDFCQKYNLLSDKNAGFKKNDGTINQLIKLVNMIFSGLDDEAEIAMVFLDLSKAFDKVCHKRLLLKLRQIGVQGNLFNGFGRISLGELRGLFWLDKRRNTWIFLDRCHKDQSLLLYCFLFFLNDIEINIRSNISLFADDVSLLEKFKNCQDLEQTINTDLDTLKNWALKWNMEFNPLKTEIMIFSNKQNKSKPIINYNGIQIKQVSTHKHLGIHLSENMQWTYHIDSIVKKANKKLGQLRRNAFKLKTKQKIDIYKSMIRPILEYGAVLFDNCSVNDSLKLDRCQRSAALICTGAMRRTETTSLMNYLGWETLQNRRKNMKMILFYKMVNKLAPSYLQKYVIFTESNYMLRTSGKVQIKPIKCRLTSFKKSFIPDSIQMWNNLPNEIQIIPNLALFKNKIKTHFPGNPGNSISPYLLFESHDGFFGKLLTQMRLQLSPLRAHLFRYNLTDNPFCPSCGEEIETTLHYFLTCRSYETPRRTLLHSLEMLNANMASDNTKLDFIIFGASDLSVLLK